MRKSVLILLFYFQIIQTQSYNVAVIEFAMNQNTSLQSADILEQNSAQYLELIDEITQNSSQALNLIIFPESTLTPSFSEAAQLPANSTILCNSTENNAQFLKDLSCKAIFYNTTIVINFTEKDADAYYNTDVAFGNNGTIIARYRKWNLFGEYGKTKPKTLDLPVILIQNTSFGMMTCFDIQFGVPAFNLTRTMGVENIIFPLNWISELPFLTGTPQIKVQQMWSQEFNVGLLASGASNPEFGAGGSGIFLGKDGPVASDILPTPGTKVLVATVPPKQLDNSQDSNNETLIDNQAEAMDGFYMLVDPSIIDHSSVILNTSEDAVNTMVCHGEESKNVLCCQFNVSFTQEVKNDTLKHYTYHLVAFNGIRTYSKLYYGGVETCGLIACLNDSIASCGRRFSNYSEVNWPLTFTSLTIKGNFTHSDQRVQFPTTLLSSIRPLSIQSYTWGKEKINSTVIRSIELMEPQTRLLTFGIFGRDFNRDWDPVRNGLSTGVKWNVLTVIVVLLPGVILFV